MKKISLLACVGLALFGNIILAGNLNSDGRNLLLSQFTNIAYASGEGGSGTYFAQSTDSGSTSGTYTTNGQNGACRTCEYSHDFVEVTCTGEGVMQCTPSYSVSNYQENCYDC